MQCQPARTACSNARAPRRNPPKRRPAPGRTWRCAEERHGRHVHDLQFLTGPEPGMGSAPRPRSSASGLACRKSASERSERAARFSSCSALGADRQRAVGGQQLVDAGHGVPGLLQHALRLGRDLLVQAVHQPGGAGQRGAQVLADFVERNLLDLVDDVAELLLQLVQVPGTVGMIAGTDGLNVTGLALGNTSRFTYSWPVNRFAGRSARSRA